MWISYMEREYLAIVDIIPVPESIIRRAYLDCEFDTLAEAIDWIIQDNPRRLSARIYRGSKIGRRVLLDLIWDECEEEPEF